MKQIKRFFSYFLFQTRPEETLSPRRKAAFWCWNALLSVGAALVLGMISLVMAPAQYGWTLFWDYLAHPGLVALNLLPPVVLMALLYGLTGRAWAAYLITVLPVLGLSLGNYYKLAFRDDPVLASDLLILGEAANMAGKYKLFLFGKLIAALGCVVLSTVLLALLARARPRLPIRGGIAAAALAAALALIPVYNSDDIYNKTANLEHINPWSATQQYISRGTMYPFLHSVKDALPTPPEGYSEKEAAAMLEAYEDADIPEDKKVNIVGVMLEAFADFSVYDSIEMQADPYAYFHALEEESYTGNLLTNIFAGGTINTERAFLTGMNPDDINYRSNTSSYVWYLKSQGYQTSGDHPSNDWFYNRVNVNSYLGFDQYRFTENFYKMITGMETSLDNIFFPMLTSSVVDQIENGGGPLFSFSVSYQGHGPYSDNICWWGEVDNYVANYNLTQEQRTILANYLGSVMSTQYFLSEMVNTFRTMDEPIVVVVFGDHKPWLGNGNSVYDALGIDLSRMSEESFYNYWSTRYLIWANDAAKEAIGNDMVGQGPDVSPCFLMNVLFEQLGWEGDAYMQAVDSCYRELPMVHASGACLTADGELTMKPAEEQAELVRRFHNLEYYRARHFSGKTG